MLIEVFCSESRYTPLDTKTGKHPPCGKPAVGMFNRVHLFAGGIQVPECEDCVMAPAKQGGIVIPSNEPTAKWLVSKGFVKDPNGASYSLPKELWA